MLELQNVGGDLEQNIRSACCIFHTFQKCIRDKNVQLCHDKNANFWDDLIGDVVCTRASQTNFLLFT